MAGPKWTPGPWRWVKEKPAAGSKPLAKLVGAGGTEVCNFGNAYDYYPSAGVEPNEYDKNLISAAPDLYEALERFVEAFERTTLVFPDQFDYSVYEKAVHALAKARGVEHD